METNTRNGSGRRRASRRRPWPVRLLQLMLTVTIAVSSLALAGVVFGQTTHRFRLAPVLSGSMSPAIDTGALVMAEPVRPSALEPGDILLFNAPIDGDPLVMHRIYDKKIQDGTAVFFTKGDANDAPDAWAIRIRGEQAWRVRHSVPYIGTVIGWLGKVGARMIVLVGGVSLLLLWGLRAVWSGTPISWHARDPHGVRIERSRRRTNRRSFTLIGVGSVGVLALATAGLAGAQFTSTPTPPEPAVGSGTLATPTGLNCSWTSATELGLGWTDASPSFTGGFNVRRSTTSGSGYSTVGTTVAPTVAYTDTPSPVTTKQYYVTQASRGSWLSGNSNEVVSNQCVRAINLVGGTTAGFSGDGGPATSAQLSSPQDVAIDNSGNLYIADASNNRVRKINASTGIITTIAGGGASTGCTFTGAATSAVLSGPLGVAVDDSGNVYISDTGNDCIRMVSAATGNISLFAGNGGNTACSYSGSPTGASLRQPRGLKYDRPNNVLYITDKGRRCIRKVTGGTMSLVVGGGNGNPSCAGSGPAASQRLSTTLSDVDVDSSGTVYVADTGASCIRQVVAGTVSLFAGNGGNTACSYAGAATSVSLSAPGGLTVDSQDRVIIADAGRNCIRIVDTAGNVSQVAGTGTAGSTGDNGPAVAALLSAPADVGSDASGDIWLVGSDRVRRIEGPL